MIGRGWDSLVSLGGIVGISTSQADRIFAATASERILSHPLSSVLSDLAA